MPGGSQHPCQHREVSCPVPVRIMDWEISVDPGFSSLGYSFPTREVNFIILLGMPPDQCCPCRTDMRAQSGRMFPPVVIWIRVKTISLSPRELYRGCLCTTYLPWRTERSPQLRTDGFSRDGVTTSCRMSGGTQHPCQHREVSCPVPVRIMDWEISGGSRIQ
jgi:hypothetical protein